MKRLAAAIALSAGLVSCRYMAPPTTRPVAEISFSLETSGPTASTAILPLSGVQIPVAASPVLTAADLEAVDIAQSEIGPCLVFAIGPEAKPRLREFAAAARGRRLVLSFNGHALGARRIDAGWNDARIFMFVEIRESELPSLVAELKAGVMALKSSRSRRS